MPLIGVWQLLAFFYSPIYFFRAKRVNRPLFVLDSLWFLPVGVMVGFASLIIWSFSREGLKPEAVGMLLLMLIPVSVFFGIFVYRINKRAKDYKISTIGWIIFHITFIPWAWTIIFLIIMAVGGSYYWFERRDRYYY